MFIWIFYFFVFGGRKLIIINMRNGKFWDRCFGYVLFLYCGRKYGLGWLCIIMSFGVCLVFWFWSFYGVF